MFFLNPDTEVVGDALAAMVAYLDAHPEVGALGPQLRYGDGSLQSSRRRFPTFATALFESTPLAWHWPANPWARRYRMEDQGSGIRDQGQVRQITAQRCTIGQDVDWVVGAALMVRREVLDQIGGFDEGYFMYSEELDLCRRIKEAGWRIVYLPTAQIIHHEGKSSEQVVAARHIRFQTSKVRYFRKFHGPLQAEALRVFILASFAVEWLFEAGKWLLGSQAAAQARANGRVWAVTARRGCVRVDERRRTKDVDTVASLDDLSSSFVIRHPSRFTMRILFITGEYPSMQGGVGDYTRRLSQALGELGADVHVLTHVDAGDDHLRVPVAAYEPTVYPVLERTGWNLWGATRALRPGAAAGSCAHPVSVRRVRPAPGGELSALAAAGVAASAGHRRHLP